MAKLEQYRNKYENIDLTRTEDGVVTWRSYQGRSDHMGGRGPSATSDRPCWISRMTATTTS